MNETLEQIVRDLHKQLPMATQEDAIEFARHLIAELGAQEPVAWMDAIDGQLWREKSEYHNRDIPLYAAPVVKEGWQPDPNCTCDEHGACAYCWNGRKLAAAPEYKP